MNGNSPSSGAPIRWKTGGSAVEHVPQQRSSSARHDEQQRDRARVVADLPQHALRGRARVIRALTPPPPRSGAGTPRPRSCSPVRSRSARGRRLARAGRRRASAASASHAAASSITWLETSSVVPPSASPWNVAHSSRAQHRVEADGRLVEHEQLRARRAAPPRARPASAGRRRACRRPAPARVARPTVVEHALDDRAGPAPSDAREVAQVLARR